PHPAPAELYTLSLHDALPISAGFGGAGDADPAPVSGSRAERYQVLLHVEHATLAEGGGEPGRSELEDGTRVSAETARRLSCDAGDRKSTRLNSSHVKISYAVF